METSSQPLTSSADRFLKKGTTNGADPAAFANACEQFIRSQSQRSLKDAIKTARRYVLQAKRFGQSRDLLLSAYRALARTAHLMASFKEAESAYIEAYRLAGKTTQAGPIRAGIDRALIDIYMYFSNFAEAKKRATSSLRYYRKIRSEAEIAKTEVNLANLLHRQDRHREAEKLYRKASLFFEKSGDRLPTARCYYNHANTLVQLFNWQEAEKLYRQSFEIYQKEGMIIDANDAAYGLAWLRMLRGEFHIALTDLADCEKVFKKAGQPKGAALCELDRAEIYLGLNLFTDARVASENAEREFIRIGIRYEQSKAVFFRARAEYCLGNFSAARKSLKKAESSFKSEGNKGFLAAVYLLKAQLREDFSKAAPEIDKARQLFAKAQLPLWGAICDVHLIGNKKYRKQALKRLHANGAARNVPHIYASWQTALGDLASQAGQGAAAKKHWQKAANRLDAVRAQLPPVELRTSFGRQERSPHLKLIDTELFENPAMAAVWWERYQTAGLWSPVAGEMINDATRMKAEQSLAALARQVAALSHNLSHYGGERSISAIGANKSIFRLQRQVRQEMATLEKSGHGFKAETKRLLQNFREVSKETCVIQFHCANADIAAIVHENGKTRLVEYPDGLAQLKQSMRQWRFLLERELLSGHLGSTGEISAENRFFDRFGEWLWKPLDLTSSVERVLILTEGEFANIPWHAIRVDSTPLASTTGFILAPSLRHYLHARSIKASSDQMEIFAGVTDNLSEVYSELSSLVELTGERARLHDPSRRDDWPFHGDAQIWHFAGHAHLRGDNPFYSYLALADGPLFAADFRLRQVKVNLVTLAACRSGEQVAMSGEEATGLVRSLLEMGARNVVAGHWPVSDKSTSLWMTAFYRHLFDKKRVNDAVRAAALQVREQYPSAYHWAPFSVFGAGD